MEILSLDGVFSEIVQASNEVKKVSLTSDTTRSYLPLVPKSLIEKWKIPKTGFYAPINVSFVLTPHISERAGVKGVVKLVDTRDSSPTRVLYQSKQFNVGTGLVIEGTQLPFCLPVGDYPLQFEVMVLQSPFKETSKLYTISLQWQMMSSTTPLSRVQSVMGEAQPQSLPVAPNFKMAIRGKPTKSKGKPVISEE